MHQAQAREVFKNPLNSAQNAMLLSVPLTTLFPGLFYVNTSHDMHTRKGKVQVQFNGVIRTRSKRSKSIQDSPKNKKQPGVRPE